MPALPFPPSSTPGALPGEGEGRLVNVYAEKQGDADVIRPVPGLAVVAALGYATPRGMIEMPDGVYIALSGAVVRVVGAAVTVVGTLPGTDGVTFARNNRVTNGVSTPDLVAVRETGGAYVVTTNAVTAFPDVDLPGNVNSVAFLDAFLLFTVPDGRIFATGVNNLTVEALSFATAEAMPDGLLRGVVKGNKLYAMGPASIEPWANNGLSPFPLMRAATVIKTGLLAASAVAGHEPGWAGPLVFVASDGTVKTLSGFETAKVSTTAVERFVAASSVASLQVCVYTFRGHAMWSLTSDQGTWEYNLSTGQWHERASAGATGWRGSRSVLSGGRWLVGDRLSQSLLAIDETVHTDAGAARAWTIESGPLKDYPLRETVPALFADFTKANAAVALSWSHDGGSTWTPASSASLTTADRYPVRWNRLGLTTHHGLRARLTGSDPVAFSFMGASVPNPERRAA